MEQLLRLVRQSNQIKVISKVQCLHQAAAASCSKGIQIIALHMHHNQCTLVSSSISVIWRT